MTMTINKKIALEILSADFDTACNICDKYLEYWQDTMYYFNDKLKEHENDEYTWLYRKQYNEARKQFNKFHTLYEML